MSQKKVTPQVPKGFQDLLPQEMMARNAVVEKIRSVYEKYGFLPVDTPVLEYRDALMGTGGAETNKQIFQLESPEGEAVAMRFDLTVPFARLIAQYAQSIKLPFRRYHVGPVFRADKPGPGRFRQFTQFDVDIAGAKTMAADAEVIAVICEALRALGLSRIMGKNGAEVQGFQIRVSNRRLVDALLEGNGITVEKTLKHVLRVMDKLQKVGIGKVRQELGPGRVDESGDPIPGVGLGEALIDTITEFVGVTAGSREATLAALAKHLPDTKKTEAALNETQELATYLDALAVSEDEAVFDPSLTRGLDYYTGPVYEIVLPAALEFGSVGAGGRYDDLCGRFQAQRVTATGASIGIDRLMAALTELGIVVQKKSSVQVCIATTGKVPKTEVLRLAGELRAAGLNTLTYLGNKKGMGAQLSDAGRYEIPVAVILGEDELAKGQVSVKDLIAGKARRQDITDHETYRQSGRETQQTVPRSQMLATIRDVLARTGT